MDEVLSGQKQQQKQLAAVAERTGQLIDYVVGKELGRARVVVRGLPSWVEMLAAACPDADASHMEERLSR